MKQIDTLNKEIESKKTKEFLEEFQKLCKKYNRDIMPTVKPALQIVVLTDEAIKQAETNVR